MALTYFYQGSKRSSKSESADVASREIRDDDDVCVGVVTVPISTLSPTQPYHEVWYSNSANRTKLSS